MPTTGRADYLLNELGRQGYSLHAPAPMQWDTPTTRPRRRNARGRQIDGVATKQTRRPDLSIDEGSFHQIGGDHDRIQAVVPISGAHAKTEGWETRPRVVTGVIPPQPGLNQARVEQLAASHTAPRRGNRYRDPHAVKQAFKQARTKETEEAWKRAQALRRRARDEWHQTKVVRGGGRQVGRTCRSSGIGPGRNGQYTSPKKPTSFARIRSPGLRSISRSFSERRLSMSLPGGRVFGERALHLPWKSCDEWSAEGRQKRQWAWP